MSASNILLFPQQNESSRRTPPPDAAVRARIAEQVPEGPMRRFFLRPRPIDFRSVEPRDWLDPQKRAPVAHCWFRTVAPLPDLPRVHGAVLAYASDFQLLATALQPHGLSYPKGDVKGASLDHAIWFHGDFRADDWLLNATDSPWSGRARGFGRGQIFTRDGRLVASVAQEATWQAPAQNSRRDRSCFGADIVILERGREASGDRRQDRGHAEIARFCKSRGASRLGGDYRVGG